MLLCAITSRATDSRGCSVFGWGSLLKVHLVKLFLIVLCALLPKTDINAGEGLYLR